jgi:hypothetical protein
VLFIDFNEFNMIIVNQFYIYIFIYISLISYINAVWTGFDLVRNRTGAWGSNETTSFVKITGSCCIDKLTNISSIGDGSLFGYAVANIGDLNNDGYDDIAVGAPGEDIDYGDENSLQQAAGAIYILFMGEDTSVIDFVRISGDSPNGPPILAMDQFGYSIAALGDLDGDGIVDVAVGAPGYIISTAYILYLHGNGSVKSHVMIRGEYKGSIPPSFNETTYNLTDISDYTYNGPPITYGCRFASAMTNIGDIDRDNVTDLAISEVDSRNGKSNVYLLLLSPNGTVKSYTTIGPNIGGGPNIPDAFTGFGSSVISIPDMNNDSIPELVVGSPMRYEAGSTNINAGEIHILFMSSNGTANYTSTISETSGRKEFGTRGVIPNVVSYNI